MPAVLETESGHSVLVMGTAAEVEAALADQSVYVEGRCVLRFACSRELLAVDPGVVVGVHDALTVDFAEPE